MSLKNTALTKSNLLPILCGILLIASGCSALRDVVQNIQKPQLSVANMHVTGFNFSEVELTFDVTVDNPNALSVRMLSYDYALKINEREFISGGQEEETRIEGSGESMVQVPVTLNFQELYSMTESLANSEEAAYAFTSTVAFDLPGLGRTEIPVSKEGDIPLVHLPEIQIGTLEIENISLKEADLVLNIEFENPNGFGLNIRQLDYDLNINGSRWAEGSTFEDISINREETVRLQIPVSLNISEMGLSAYKMLTGSREVAYEFNGSFTFGTTHPLLGEADYSFDRAGQLSLRR